MISSGVDVQVDKAFGLLLISVATAHTTIRDAARKQIRDAVRETVALHFGVPAAEVDLTAIPGQAPRLSLAGRSALLSISHEPGLSVAAVSLLGPVGIDIMRVDCGFDWRDVTRDYLEPEAVSRIIGTPASEQAGIFAYEWTRLEARLKCLGRALVEQSKTRDAELQTCQTRPVRLPEGLGLVGHVAWREMHGPATRKSQRVQSDNCLTFNDGVNTPVHGVNVFSGFAQRFIQLLCNPDKRGALG